MEIRILILGVSSLLFSACSTGALNSDDFNDVYVQDFHSDKPKECTTSDVNLSHKQAHEFFKRSKIVDRKIIHDHYEYAPCYIEGTLKYKEKSCDWRIRAGSTGSVKCGDKIWLFACDDCDDLFIKK